VVVVVVGMGPVIEQSIVVVDRRADEGSDVTEAAAN